MTRTDGRDRKLEAVLAAASAPACPKERDESALGAVLAAFNAAGTGEPAESGEPAAASGRTARDAQTGTARRRARWSAGAAVVFIFVGSGVAAADAGILPRPIQSLAHHVFGGLGVPAPRSGGDGRTSGVGRGASSSAVPAPQTTATAQSSADARTGAAASATPSPDGTTVLVSLCSQVISDGDSWKRDLSRQAVALLTATAGKERKVVPYCTALLSTAQQATATPSPSPTATPTVTPSASASSTPRVTPSNGNGGGKKHGKGHKAAGRSANPTPNPAPIP